MVELVFTRLVAARVLFPEMDNCTTGESAIGSENVAVMVKDVPDLTGWVVEYVMAAVGAVVSKIKLALDIDVHDEVSELSLFWAHQ